MKKLKYKRAYVSISGDYYQIGFDDDPAEPEDPTDVDQVMDSLGHFFLIQHDFEFPSRKSYIESDDENLIGHYIVNSVVIGRSSFTVKYGPNDKYKVNIEYDETTDEEHKELINASTEMFVNVEVI
ncbi:hypothetical protein SAMN02746065_117117 [Desulfocicer vacuolatum DSM 3385]|uniref:Uncharacterized protein n=1 Tax=Desulfocicer vacuolatum DSM 3385 TaxID=1121400 RepID=A0A1W2DIG7_9BACT|nr:hypothetical protein [Desulfocicer vacuolatum]SMC96788.1 hypothetical protein SAMN02746065_117117 [Desulfocicer vacuolatum DSM 3385]